MTTLSGNEIYSVSDAEAQRAYVSVRRAAQWIDFFLPYLKTGFSVLDCGCGVGSITLDIADLVAPGQVIGIDVDESQLEIARINAQKRGLTNVSFEQSNAYTLPFADKSFDAILAHTLLYHLSDPVRALREFYRILTPGGVVGISDDDLETATFSPDLPFWHRVVELWTQVMRHNGGNPFYSRHLRRFLLEAGFEKTAGFAVAAEHYGTLDKTRQFASVVSGVFHSPDFVALVVRHNWSTPAELDDLLTQLQRWGERPDAFFAMMYCAAVGWKPQQQ
jgi:ubiquinone/menaquinone biosynthesis C-methylase UbiE